jgi:TUP1-like enhancer of split/HIRA B motif
MDTSDRVTQLQQQQETISKSGKKRIRPLLLSLGAESASGGLDKNNKISRKLQQLQTTNTMTSSDPIQTALDVASRATAIIEQGNKRNNNDNTINETSSQVSTSQGRQLQGSGTNTFANTRTIRYAGLPFLHASATIPHSTDKVYVADLPSWSDDNDNNDMISSKPVAVVECKNKNQVPIGTQGIIIPCIDISIVRNGIITWKDQIAGAFCTAVTACKNLIAVGMVDGSIQFYATSQTNGWESGIAYRSHPPMILMSGYPIVLLQMLNQNNNTNNNPITLNYTSMKEDDNCPSTNMLVLTGDGSFGMYSIVPKLELQYKGSVMSAILHMSASSSSLERLAKVARLYISETDRLVLVLSLNHVPNTSTNTSATTGTNTNNNINTTSASSSTTTTRFAGVGGSLQAFVYEKGCESWMRISDSRFLLSDYYSNLPSNHLLFKKKKGTNTQSNNTTGTEDVMSKLDDTVRLGSMQSILRKSLQRGQGQKHRANQIYDQHGSLLLYSNQEQQNGGNDSTRGTTYIVTRAHCEDRMASAVALNSPDEFKTWLTLYVQTLTRASNGSQLRTLTDILLGPVIVDDNVELMNTESSSKTTTTAAVEHKKNSGPTCWWLATAPSILGLDRKILVESIVIPEMSKNRGLQRYTNEIAIEVSSL